MKWILPTVAVLALVYVFTRTAQAAQVATVDESEPITTEDTEQLPTPIESLIVNTQTAFETVSQTVADVFTGAPEADPDIELINLQAFLNVIAWAEGTSGPKGYQTMFGYRYFSDFSDHPRQYFSFTNSKGQTLKTSAAGRYQFLARTWDALAQKLSLPDFSPESQDLACIELIRERGALADVKAGRVQTAIQKCAPVWASLPGAGYSQPERKLNALMAEFQQQGGTLEA